jgi:phosphonate transport system substrate-binding protein
MTVGTSGFGIAARATGAMSSVLAAGLFASAAFALEPSGPQQSPAAASQLQAGQAVGWRSELGVFRFGIVRGWSADSSTQAVARLQGSLSASLAMSVRIAVFDRFSDLIDAHAEGRIDAAAYSSRAFAAARLLCECIDAVAAPSGADGASGLAIVLLSVGGTAPAKWGALDAVRAVAFERTLQSAIGSRSGMVWFPDSAKLRGAVERGEIGGVAALVPASMAGGDPVIAEGAVEAVWADLTATADVPASRAFGRPGKRMIGYDPNGPVAVRSKLPVEAVKALSEWLSSLETADPAVHAILSDGLAGKFAAIGNEAYADVTADIRQLAAAAP